jgi:hypothetical protein
MTNVIYMCLRQLRFQRRSQNCEKRLLDSSCLSDHPSAQNNSAPAGQIFIKFDISIYHHLSRKLIFHQNPTRITSTSHKYLRTFMIPRLIFLKMRNISDKIVRKSKHIFSSTSGGGGRPPTPARAGEGEYSIV